MQRRGSNRVLRFLPNRSEPAEREEDCGELVGWMDGWLASVQRGSQFMNELAYSTRMPGESLIKDEGERMRGWVVKGSSDD